MDKLDLAILKLLLAANGTPPGAPQLRRSFRSMGKDLKVDQGTIRSRIKKLQESRVLRGWYLAVSPAISGKDVIHAWLTVKAESRKDDIVRKLLSVEDVERVCDYFGPRVSLVLLNERQMDPNLALDRLASATGLRRAMRMQAFIHVPPRALKESDAAIIESLRIDPWKPYSTIAKELRLSARTVKRRVTHLADSGAISMLPVIDLKALHGIIPMELVVDYSSRESRAAANGAILSRIKENLVFSDVSGGHGYFALFVPNISHVEQIAEWVRRQNGVRDVHADALQEVVLNPKHYQHEVTPEIARDGRGEPTTVETPL